jgi:hypothetical protein
MSDETQPVDNVNYETQPVDKVRAKAVQAAALVRKLGLERAMRAVATARKYEQAGLGFPSTVTFTTDEVALLIQLTKVHVSADDLAVVVKTQVNEVLG